MNAEDPLYILYTSGTTGAPKGVVHDNGGHAVAVHWSMNNIFNAEPGCVIWTASDIGWAVGHSYSVYGPLLNRCTSVLYEGKPVGTPDAANFWRVIERHKVNILSTSPTAIREIRRQDSEGILPQKFNLSSLRTVFVAGERADRSMLEWAERSLKVPIRDNWWQTETSSPICSNLVGVDEYLPVKYGSVFGPCPGFDLEVLDELGAPVPRGTVGSLVLKLPLPPGALITLYNNEERFRKAYLNKFPGYYETGDAGMIDEDGYVYVMSRTDDVINVAGHRLSTGAMEEVRYRDRNQCVL
jgi:propionyl-CoA synthetase